MVQWLGLSAFTAVARVQLLVRELKIPQAVWGSQKKPPKNPKKQKTREANEIKRAVEETANQS